MIDLIGAIIGDISNAISVGGGSDMLAAITGGVAEAFYGVPAPLRLRAESFLDGRLKEIYGQFVLWLEAR